MNGLEPPPQGDEPAELKPRAQRSLEEKILVAFHYACDSGDLNAAERLLKAAAVSLISNRNINPSRLCPAKDGYCSRERASLGPQAQLGDELNAIRARRGIYLNAHRASSRQFLPSRSGADEDGTS